MQGPTKPDDGFGERFRCGPSKARAVGRPEGTPCGGPSALSWDHAALRGLAPGSLRRTWVPSARSAFPRPPGFHEPGRWDGSLHPPALLALPLPFRGPSRHRRTVAGTPRGPRVRRCSLPWAFVPHDTCRNGGPVTRGASRPHGVPRARFGYLLRGVHPRPSGRPCGPRASTGFALRGVLLAPVGLPLGRPLPSCRSSRRFASLLKVRADASGSRASIPASSSFGPPCPRGRGASMPPCDSSLQSALPHRPAGRFGSRPLPHHALGGMTSRPACVSRSSGAVDVVGPSRGYRLSWDLPPHDRHGAAADVGRAGSWLRLAGRGDSAPDTALNPLVTSRPGPRGSRPGAAVFR